MWRGVAMSRPIHERIAINLNNVHRVRRLWATGSDAHARVIADCARTLLDARQEQTMDDAFRVVERQAEECLRSAVEGWR